MPSIFFFFRGPSQVTVFKIIPSKARSSWYNAMHSTDAGQFTQYALDVCCHMPKNNIVLQLVLLGTDLMMCNAFKFISSVFSVTEDLPAAILPQISYCLSNSTKVPLQLKTEISQG